MVHFLHVAHVCSLSLGNGGVTPPHARLSSHLELWCSTKEDVLRAMQAKALLLCLLATCTQAFVLPAAQPGAVARSCGVAMPISMTSLDKKEKAKHIKAKSSRAATKRFKATATGKLLRRRPFKQHILTKKHPLRKQKLNKCAALPAARAGAPEQAPVPLPAWLTDAPAPPFWTAG